MPDTSRSVGFDGVGNSYAKGMRAVDGVPLEIAGGGFVALVGASGSGKSTLLKMVNRLIEPSEGRVLIDGAPVAAEPPHLLRRRIGYVFQNVALFPHLTVGENVGIGLRLAGVRDRDARIVELLRLVALPEAMARRMPDALSGGGSASGSASPARSPPRPNGC